MRMSLIHVAECTCWDNWDEDECDSTSWGHWDEDECDCCCRVYILRWLGWGCVWLLLQNVHPEVIRMGMSVIPVAKCTSWGDWDEDEWFLLQSVHPEVIGMKMSVIPVAECTSWDDWMKMSVIPVTDCPSWGDWDEDECVSCCRVFILRWFGWGWVIPVAECPSWGDWDGDKCDSCCKMYILRWLGWRWVWFLLQSVHPEMIGWRWVWFLLQIVRPEVIGMRMNVTLGDFLCILTLNTGQLNHLFHTFGEFRPIENRVVVWQSPDWFVDNAQFSTNVPVVDCISYCNWNENKCDSFCRMFILRSLGWGWVWFLLQSVHPKVIGMRMSVIGWGWVWFLLQSVRPEVIGMRMSVIPFAECTS